MGPNTDVCMIKDGRHTREQHEVTGLAQQPDITITAIAQIVETGKSEQKHFAAINPNHIEQSNGNQS